MVVVELSLLPGLVDGPAVVYRQPLQPAPEEHLNGFFDVDHPLDEEADIGLLLHLVPAVVHCPLKLEALPVLSLRVEEGDDAVEQVKWEPQEVESLWLELLSVVVDEELSADLELKGVFAEGLHAVEEDQHHPEKTANVG